MDREGALSAFRKAISLGAADEVADLVSQALALEPAPAL
jgi:hypothetical protein